MHFAKAGFQIVPVVHSGQRPDGISPTVFDGYRLGGAGAPLKVLSPETHLGDVQHHGCRIDADNPGAKLRRTICGNPGPTADVDDVIARLHLGQANRKFCSRVAAEQESDGSGEALEAREAGVRGVMIGFDSLHDNSLTLELGFKSSDDRGMSDEPHKTIGQVAALLDVATSTLRYYERRGLVVADQRVSGQRRYGPATVRRLVFVQMLQEGGLSLDEIDAVLHSGDNATWKGLAADRMVELDAEIARLTHARELLEAALLCRFDHPLDDCAIMNDEIDRRLMAAG